MMPLTHQTLLPKFYRLGGPKKQVWTLGWETGARQGFGLCRTVL